MGFRHARPRGRDWTPLVAWCCAAAYIAALVALLLTVRGWL